VIIGRFTWQGCAFAYGGAVRAIIITTPYNGKDEAKGDKSRYDFFVGHNYN
jgi:hypothetical protein